MYKWILVFKEPLLQGKMYQFIYYTIIPLQFFEKEKKKPNPTGQHQLEESFHSGNSCTICS